MKTKLLDVLATHLAATLSITAFLLLPLWLTPSAGASTVTVGTANTNNAIPFSDVTNDTPYQQIYSASSFTGTMLINQIVFYDTQLNAYSIPNGTFNIQLSTTSKSITLLSLTYTSNLGSDNITVYSASLPSATGNEIIIPLSATFLYDPSNGNLLMTVIASGNSGGFHQNGLDADDASLDMSRLITLSGTPQINNNYGLVTSFSTVPLPAALPLFATGVGALGLLGWRRKRKAAALSVLIQKPF